MVSALLLLLLTARHALAAGEYVVEIGRFESRDQAESYAVPKGEGAVVKRYVEGVGWRYIVVVDGLDGLEAAQELAAEVARNGQSAEVIELPADAGTAPIVVSVDLPNSPPPAATMTAAAAPLPDAGAVLTAAAKAHGGKKGLGAQLEGAPAVELRVERTIHAEAGPLVFRSRYVRQADARRVEVVAISGKGKSSVTIVPALGLPGMTVEGVPVVVDPARARQAVELFAPEAVFGGILALPAEVTQWTQTTGIVTVSRAERRGVELVVLTRTGPGGTALAEGVTAASFGVGDHLFRSITWATPEGEVTWEFDDYRLVEGVSVPHQVTILRDGKEVERTQVARFDLVPTVNPAELGAGAAGG